MNISALLDNIIFFNLLLVTIISWASLIYPTKNFLPKLSLYGTCFVNALLFLLLGLRWFNYGYFPLSNLYESLMFLAWGITFITIIIENRSKINLVGSISLPIALFVSAFAGLSLPESMQAPSPLVPALKSNWLMMHVTVMMLSYASLLVGSLLAIFFLILLSNSNGKNINLKGNSYGIDFSSETPSTSLNTVYYKTDTQEKNLLSNSASTNVLVSSSGISGVEASSSNRLNLLESIDNLSYRTISFGFPLLTVGIISGAVWANEAWGSYWSWDPKETWALVTWIVFATYLHSRITKGWEGKKTAILGGLGFFVIWICYLGVNFLGKGLHSYGWLS